MKPLILLLCSIPAFAQYEAIPSTSYAALDAILNAKLTFQTGTAAPSGACTAGKDIFVDTTGKRFYYCHTTGTGADKWALVGAKSTFDNGTCNTTETIDANNGEFQKVTLGANCTISFTQPTSGEALVRLTIIQGASPWTVTWTSTLWPTAIPPVITGTAAAEDEVNCRLNGTTVKCTHTADFR